MGDGTNIHIWDDLWIPREYVAKPITPNLQGRIDCAVSSLIDRDPGGLEFKFIGEFVLGTRCGRYPQNSFTCFCCRRFGTIQNMATTQSAVLTI